MSTSLYTLHCASKWSPERGTCKHLDRWEEHHYMWATILFWAGVQSWYEENFGHCCNDVRLGPACLTMLGERNAERGSAEALRAGVGPDPQPLARAASPPRSSRSRNSQYIPRPLASVSWLTLRSRTASVAPSTHCTALHRYGRLPETHIRQKCSGIYSTNYNLHNSRHANIRIIYYYYY